MASPKLPPRPLPHTIGFTYGTFDLFHDGHRHFLREARSRCDQLIVAIDSDRLARQRKGPGRPVDDEATRSHNVVASGLVTLVIAVDDRSQLTDAAEYYQPEIIFAGDDGKARGNEEGARPAIVLIPRLAGFSTSRAIRDRLQ